MTIATNGVGAGARLAARRIEMEVDDVNVRGALFAAGFGLLLLGGCGDDDHEAADKTADASADDLSAREEQSIVDSAVLTLSDLPSGWSDNAAADTSEDALEKRQQREIAACIGVEYERLYGHGTSAEAAFVSPDGGELSSSVGLEESGDDAKFVIDTLASEAAASCLIDQLQSITEDQGGGTGVEARDVSLQRLSFPEVVTSRTRTASRSCSPVIAK